VESGAGSSGSTMSATVLEGCGFKRSALCTRTGGRFSLAIGDLAVRRFMVVRRFWEQGPPTLSEMTHWK
jgi:hypothetical protein